MVGLRGGVAVAVAAGNSQVYREKIVGVAAGCSDGASVGESGSSLGASVRINESVFCVTGVEVLKSKDVTTGSSCWLGEKY